MTAGDRGSVLVIGGGTMGTASAWALAKRGVQVRVFEQFSHVHSLGSHGGQTRIFRHAYSEGAAYVPLMEEADRLWCELQDEIGLPIVHRVGILEMDAPGQTHAHTARESGDRHGVPYDWMDGAEIRRRFPSFQPPDDWSGGYSDRAGFLDVEPALQGMAMLAQRQGTEFFEREPITGWGADNQGVWVDTTSGRHTADRLVVTAGAWTTGLLQDLGLPLTVVRKVLWWFDVEEPDRFQPSSFPVWAAATSQGEIYGFPLYGQPGLKVSDHHGGETTTPDTVDRIAADSEKRHVADVATRLLPGLTDRVVSSAVCLYTRTPDEHFVIDRHPDHPNVAFAGGFSGHGFKFATVVGEHLADLSLDPAATPFPIFRADRFVAVS